MCKSPRDTNYRLICVYHKAVGSVISERFDCGILCGLTLNGVESFVLYEEKRGNKEKYSY